MSPLEKLFDKLRDREVRPHGEDNWRCKCPAHDGESETSLSITQLDGGKLLLQCFAGCSPIAILTSLDLQFSDLYPETEAFGGKIVATYDYRDANGELKYQVCRLEPKSFRRRAPKDGGGWNWSTKGIRSLLYRLPELAAADPTEPVFFVEGEKDADNIANLGLRATTNGSAGARWLSTYTEHFAGRVVYLLPDNDAPGREHAHSIARRLAAAAAQVKVIELPNVPEKGDVSDWLAGGGTRDELIRLAADAPVWTAEAADNASEAATAETRDRQRSVLETLQLHILHEDVNRAFSLYCARTNKQMSFSRLQDLNPAEMIRLCGSQFEDEIATLEAPTENQLSFDSFRLALARELSETEQSQRRTLGHGLWRLPHNDAPLILVHCPDAYELVNDRLQPRIGPLAPGVMPDLDIRNRQSWLDLDLLRSQLEAAWDPEYRKAVCDEILSYLSTWCWKTPEDAEVALGLIFATWVQTLLDWRPIVFVTGDTNSGKTWLLEMLSWIFLSVSSVSAGGSAAGFIQRIRTNALPVLLDEFDTLSVTNQRHLLEYLRAASRGQVISKGTANQQGKEYRLQHLCWLSGISQASAKKADLNRQIVLHLQGSTVRTIRRPTRERARVLGHQTLACAIVMVDSVISQVAALASAERPPTGVELRYVESYAVPFGALGAIRAEPGTASRERMETYLKNNLAAGQDIVAKNDSEQIIDAILNTIVRLPRQQAELLDQGEATVGEILTDPHFVGCWELLERRGLRVLEGKALKGLDSEETYLAVHVSTLVGRDGLLGSSDEWRGNHGLGLILKRAPEFVGVRDAKINRKTQKVILLAQSLLGLEQDE